MSHSEVSSPRDTDRGSRGERRVDFFTETVTVYEAAEI